MREKPRRGREAEDREAGDADLRRRARRCAASMRVLAAGRSGVAVLCARTSRGSGFAGPGGGPAAARRRARPAPSWLCSFRPRSVPQRCQHHRFSAPDDDERRMRARPSVASGVPRAARGRQLPYEAPRGRGRAEDGGACRSRAPGGRPRRRRRRQRHRRGVDGGRDGLRRDLARRDAPGESTASRSCGACAGRRTGRPCSC